MISIEVIALVLTGMSIAASITYYAVMIRNQNKAKERELVNQRISTLTPEFYRNWRKIMFGDWQTEIEHLQHVTENPDDQDGFNFIAVTFNSLGVLLQKKLLSHDLVFSIYAPHFVIWTWERLSSIIALNRELMNYDLWSGFEYMYEVAIREYPNITKGAEYMQKRNELLNR